MSLINREDLMLTLGITDMDCEKCGWYSRATEQCKRGSDFEDACCAIEDAPEVLPEPKWIPVSERLPDEGVHILISIPDGVTYGWFNGCYFIQDLAHNNKRLMVVEAWQPLPEKYRGEGEQNG